MGSLANPPKPYTHLFPLSTFPYTKTINGHEIAFTDHGFAHPGPAIVTFSGWAQDHRGWANITPYLMQHHRVISVCMRGHGPNRDPVEEYDFADHARDVVALLDELAVDGFVCLAASHASFSAMFVAEMVGRERMPAIIICDHVMKATKQLTDTLQALQGRDTWHAGMLSFFKHWLGTAGESSALREQLLVNTGGFGYAEYCRSGRVNSELYRVYGSPMGRMETLVDPPLIHHVYSQPTDAAYEEMHEEFAEKHAGWFSYLKAPGDTHFPHMEQPELVAREVSMIISKAAARPAVEAKPQCGTY